MELAQAARAAAPRAPEAAIEGLLAAAPALDRAGVLATPRRAAHLIGQAAHESAGFTRDEEDLHYTTAARLMAVWPGRFAHQGVAAAYLGTPQALAEHVYGGRMGNARPGDGWRYRGRGWLMLTGRANYRRMGAALGLDLEARPERAGDPLTAWRIAGQYLAVRRRAGASALDWADRDAADMVTRIVNGALHGLADRMARTARALAVLTPLETWQGAARPGARGIAVAALQASLARAGEDPGPLDGVYGPRTGRALAAHLRPAVAPAGAGLGA